MNLIRKIFDFRATPVLAAVFIILFIAERKRPLRKATQPLRKRLPVNILLAVPAVSLLRFSLLPAMVAMAGKNIQNQWGPGYQLKAHPIIKTIFVFLVLDYTNYIWHILNHKIPFLWRFHLVHHTDTDLDVSTAIRFHFGEMVGSVFYRGVFVYLSGATPMNVMLYELLFEGATQFHHSNLKLPFQMEKAMNKIIVTPRMHGIHHSIKREETDSNYSVIFSFWDRFHQTLNFNETQHNITIGVPSYNKPEELTVRRLLTMPFTKIRNWEN